MSRTSPVETAAVVRLGLRENLAQFSLLVAVNALVGGMVGQERTVLPLLATRTFGLGAFTAGAIASRWGLRPGPFLLGIAFAALGLGLSTLFVAETRGYAHHEVAGAPEREDAGDGFGAIFARATWRDPTLSAVSQAGLVNNAVDGLAWGILPLLCAAHGLSVEASGLLAAVYPGVRWVGQLFTGSWSDCVGRKPLIVAGMVIQGAALPLMALTTGLAAWAVGAVLIGVGTALVYPTLIAAVGDVAHPTWRATAVGVHRLWRDAGYVVGALLGGVVADAFNLGAAVMVGAILSVASGVVVAARMEETAVPSGPGRLDRAGSGVHQAGCRRDGDRNAT